MEVSYSDLKNKEVINVLDGKKLGHIIDIIFDNLSGQVNGIVVPGDKKLFRKSEDIFVPLTKIKKIGDDVILIVLNNSRFADHYPENVYNGSASKEHRYENSMNVYYRNEDNLKDRSYVRYKRIDGKKYK